ncbi:MAG: hypothetical protein GF350_02420, partial [Chitinivibrionales bacterium]|nr:hypothetical protein [Chitinivibrionales bacterium]
MRIKDKTEILAFLLTWATAVCSQSWVTTANGPGSNDEGSGASAILLRQDIDIYNSPVRSPENNRLSYNHPSCLDETDKGTIILCWNGGTSESTRENRIYCTRRVAGSSTWSDPMMVEDGGQIDYGTVYQARNVPDAPIICGYWWGGCCWQGSFRYSTDDGLTWSNRIECPTNPIWYQGPMTMGMNAPLEWPNGDLWFASYTYKAGDRPINGEACITKVPHDNYTNEAGKTPWSGQNIQGGHADGHYMGTWLVLSPDYNELMYIARTNFNQGPYYAVSTDKGQTWTNDWPKAGGFGSNGISGVSLDVDRPSSPLHGWHVSTGGHHGTLRLAINVHVSNDPLNASSWVQKIQLRKQEINNQDGENADPTVMQSRDGSKVCVLFTGRGSHHLRYYEIDAYKLTGVSPNTTKARSTLAQSSSLVPNDGNGVLYSLQGRRLKNQPDKHRHI